MQATNGLAIVVVRNVIMVVMCFMTHQCNDFSKLLKLSASGGVESNNTSLTRFS